jgi:hypothetical protein
MSSAMSEQPFDGAVYPSDDDVAAQLSLVNAKIPVTVDPAKAANVASDGSILRRSPYPA